MSQPNGTSSTATNATAAKKNTETESHIESSSLKRKHCDDTQAKLIDLTEDDDDDDDEAATDLAAQTAKRLKPSKTTARAAGLPITPQKSTAANSVPTQLVTPKSLVKERPTIISNATIPQPAPIEVVRTLPPSEIAHEKNELYRLPELADRYVAKTSVADRTEYTNPQKFVLKPAYWRKWTKRHYSAFAEHLRAQFDPIPFARETGKPVEEVKHMFSSVVCNPLYDAAEAKKRGEEGMQEILELHEMYGTRNRQWGKKEDGAKSVVGELDGVTPGIVKIILENGSKGEVMLHELSKEDIQYLGQTLTIEDRKEIQKK